LKKLISSKNLEEIVAKGVKEIVINKDTILTPLAKDIIKNNGLKIIVKEESKENLFSNMDMNKLMEFFKLASTNEHLKNAILKMLLNEKKFEQEIDSSGFTLTKGDSIKYDKLFNSSNTFYQEIVNNQEEVITFLKIENDEFVKTIKSKGNLYVIDGEIELAFDEKKYFGKKGDLINIPKDIEIKISSKNIAKLLCFSKDLNWR
jgi:ethanolamine utilization protein EutQ